MAHATGVDTYIAQIKKRSKYRATWLPTTTVNPGDIGVDGHHAAVAAAVHDDIVAGADVLLTQHGPDHVEQANNVGTQSRMRSCRMHRGERTSIGSPGTDLILHKRGRYQCRQRNTTAKTATGTFALGRAEACSRNGRRVRMIGQQVREPGLPLCGQGRLASGRPGEAPALVRPAGHGRAVSASADSAAPWAGWLWEPTAAVTRPASSSRAGPGGTDGRQPLA